MKGGQRPLGGFDVEIKNLNEMFYIFVGNFQNLFLEKNAKEFLHVFQILYFNIKITKMRTLLAYFMGDSFFIIKKVINGNTLMRQFLKLFAKNREKSPFL